MSSREATLGKNSTIILQSIFKFCDPTQELFQNIRLVSKAWKHAIEKMRYDQTNSELLWDELIKTHNGNFPTFLNKYLQIFNKLDLWIPHSSNIQDNTDEDLFEHWDSLRPLILNNFKNLSSITIQEIMKFEDHEYPENFEDFLLELIQNSQNTLRSLRTSYNFFPPFTLPKLEEFRINTCHLKMEGVLTQMFLQVTQTSDLFEEIFGLIFKQFVERAVSAFPELSWIVLDEDDIKFRHEQHTEGTTDPIIQIMLEKYSNHLSTSMLRTFDGNFYIVPPKIAYFEDPPRELTMFSELQYLGLNLSADNFENLLPGWSNFETFIESCPKLESIFCEDFTKKDFWNCNFPTLSEESKKIWKDRFLLLQSRGVTFYFKEIENNFDIHHERLQKQLGTSFHFLTDNYN